MHINERGKHKQAGCLSRKRYETGATRWYKESNYRGSLSTAFSVKPGNVGFFNIFVDFIFIYRPLFAGN
jgi:hypothetical protein